MPDKFSAFRLTDTLPRFLGAILLLFALNCLYYATLYADLHSTAQQVNQAFNALYVGKEIPTPLSHHTETDVDMLKAKLPHDGDAQIAAVKTQMLNWNHEGMASPVDVQQALMRLSKTEQTQPTHYQAFVVRIALLHHFNVPDNNFIDELNKGLAIGPFEWEFQSLIAPVLVAQWHRLPPHVQQKALPVIRGALRQKPTRERLIATMEREKNVSPFIRLSPSKWITKRLRKIESELASNEV
ncbi:hypothetical protein [Aestuariibacter sp. A3R04]|uniref:hypothetical protein n=1 Tax=Aestuariibacter sp. A3R04 TaxID=2841571 RepID=UPI001C0993FB|nr:hypothetical protein [Aestuariibacter sp. A3R04]MBU3020909.1 hypothetical protein [Aestuariibacter sp. A3R04]